MTAPAAWGAPDDQGRYTCPDCGRRVRPNRHGTTLARHYSATNPPVYGAWIACPGPTLDQRELARRSW